MTKLLQRLFLWLEPILVVGVTILASILIVEDIKNDLRPILIVLFVLFVPGLAYVRLLRITDRAMFVGLTITLSLVINLLVSMSILYFNLWSVTMIWSICAIVTLVGVLLYLRQLWNDIKVVHLVMGRHNEKLD